MIYIVRIEQQGQLNIALRYYRYQYLMTLNERQGGNCLPYQRQRYDA